MIDEAIGKIIGMAMAYLASSMGLLLAYINYRKRILRADRVMTKRAWLVVAVSVVMTLGAAVTVVQLAKDGDGVEPPVVEEPAPPAAALMPRVTRVVEPGRWSLIGIIVPALVFLLATSVTAGLYRHFSHRQ